MITLSCWPRRVASFQPIHWSRTAMRVGFATGSGALIFIESLRDNAEFSGDCSPLTPPHEVGHMFRIPDTLAPPGSDPLMLTGVDELFLPRR